MSQQDNLDLHQDILSMSKEYASDISNTGYLELNTSPPLVKPIDVYKYAGLGKPLNRRYAGSRAPIWGTLSRTKKYTSLKSHTLRNIHDHLNLGTVQDILGHMRPTRRV